MAFSEIFKEFRGKGNTGASGKVVLWGGLMFKSFNK